MSAQISWGFCPNGVDTTKNAFRFSVLVSPQIAALSDLGSTAWPALMKAMSPSIAIGGTTIALSTAMLDATLIDAYPTLWATLFPPTAPVVSSTRPNYSGASIISYDTHTASQQVHAAYQQLAQTPTPKPIIANNPLISTLLQQSQDALPPAKAAARSVLKVPTLPAGGVPKIIRAPGGPVLELSNGTPLNPVLYYAAMFHNRGDMRQAGVAPAAPTPPAPDFHDVLAQLADQPEVLRALGMILDYEVPFASIPASLYTTGSATVNVRFVPAGVPGTQITPMTTCQISTATATTPASFYAATTVTTTPTQVDRGMLTIDDSRFLVEQLDIDHAVSTLTNASANADLATTDPSSLPALQSRGFNFLHQNRDQHVGARIANSQAVMAAGSSAVLASDDIVRGYRVDVSTDGIHWSSLCKRQGTVTVVSAATAVTVTLPTPATPASDYVSARDEGYVKASAPTSPADSPGLLQVGESMFGWHGWSLVARHPAKAAGFSATGVHTTVLKSDPNASPAGSPYQVSQQVVAQPGSLPKLRYGKQYRFRARVVDLAGNSVPLSTTTAHVTSPQTFGRYDPVITPTLVPRKRITEGEALERLVVRSSGATGVTATAFAATIDAATGQTSTPQYFGTCERHVAPPKTSHNTAELHGMFDALFATNPAAAFTIASNNGSFLQPQTGWNYVNPSPGGAQVLTSLPAPLSTIPGAAPTNGAYVFIDVPAVTVPYLPDPLATGMRVGSSAMAFAQPALATSLAFPASSWPTVTPFRMVLQDSNGAAPSLSTSDGNIDVFIPAGTMLWLDYSSTMPASALSSMGWYQELVERPAGTVASLTLASIEAAAAGGQHWMFTPKRQIQLVHATLQPVQAPALTNFSATRAPQEANGVLGVIGGANNTFAYLNGTIAAHSPSTAHVALLASWFEWDDNQGAWIPHAANVALTQFEYADGPKNLGNATQQFADTKARQISYTPVATTRYREYFPTEMTANASAITLAGAAVAPGAAHGSLGPGVVIPSSRNPPAPRPLYVIPSFLRTASAGASTRLGGALRVYVDRPWFDSGFGEQLAVVCRPANPPAGGVAASVDKLSTCGVDPLFELFEPISWTGLTAPPIGMLASNFTVDASGRMKLISNYPLADGSYVDLVVYDVERSQDGRGLFFADILIPVGFTFASFSVARYQPNSIPGLELSSLARTDYTRIAPDRSASVTSTASSVTVTVTGASLSTETAPQPAAPGGGGGVGGGTGGGGGGGTPPPVGRTPAPQLNTQPTPVQYGKAATAGRYVQATVEYTTNPAPADLDNEIGWLQGATVMLTATSTPDAWVTWSNTIALTRSAGMRYRVVIREFEVRSTDADAAQEVTGSWMGSDAGHLDALVYSDILAIT